MLEARGLADHPAASHFVQIMLLDILLVILVLDCVALAGVILLQRSEGGALGMGGGPTGMFTARGAGDLLTRTTWILATVFFVLSLGITLLAGHGTANSSITDRLKVGPADLQALAKERANALNAPPSSSEAAPPLPTAAPPLPTAPAAAMPTQAPRPSAPRPINQATSANSPLNDIQIRRPTGANAPRPDINAPVLPGSAPASSQPAGNP